MKNQLLTLSLLFISSLAYPQNWNFVQKLEGTSRSISDRNGASVDISDDIAVVGAIGENTDSAGMNQISGAGAVFVYERQQDSTWELLQKITANDRGSLDNFGQSVAIQGDYIIVGAPRQDYDETGMNQLADAGAAYVYKKNVSTGKYSQIKKLVPLNREAGALFGSNVDIYANIFVVGAPIADSAKGTANEIKDCGAVYVFDLVGNTWTEQDKLYAKKSMEDDRFGFSLSIYGNNLVVGGFQNGYDINENNPLNASGAVYVFKKQFDNTWLQTHKLVAPDRQSVAYFGVSVVTNGRFIVIGASGNNTDSLNNNVLLSAGAVYVFENINNNWIGKQKITSTKRAADAYYGTSVDIDGDYLVIGSHKDRTNAQGNATAFKAGTMHIYRRNFQNKWLPQKVYDGVDRNNDDDYGISVGIDNRRIIVGQYGEDDDTLFITDVGASHVYELYCQHTNSTVSVTACGIYTSPSGNYNWDASGTYYDIVTNVSGCDSVMTINLTIANETFGTLTDTGCGSYTSPSGKHVWISSGTYKDTIQSNQGCDSIITVNLTIIDFDKTVSVAGAILTANQANASYQWIDCEDNSDVPGETGQVYIAQQNRDFAVIISYQQCVDTSECITVTKAGVLDLGSNIKVNVYPNPTDGGISIDFGQAVDGANITIINSLGQTILEQRNFKGEQWQGEFDGDAGVYFVFIELNGKTGVVKISKE